MFDVIIIGGGASGILSSILAGKAGLKTLLLEKNDRVGKKLLTTGNGRCNFTNRYIEPSKFHGKDTFFLSNLFKRYDYFYIKDLFYRMGIESFFLEENGKAYPNSLQSSTFLDILRMEMSETGVVLKTNENIKDVTFKDHFTVFGKAKYQGKNLIVATGGMSMPKTGSDGGGYKLLKKFGHKDTKTLPALTQLKASNPHLKAMDGVKLENTKISLYADGNIIGEETGDFLFTSYGCSGPTVLNLSRLAVIALSEGKNVEIGIEIRKEGELINRFSSMKNRSLEEGMIGLINKRLIIPILKTLNLDWNMSVRKLKREDIKRIEKTLCDFRMKIIGDTGFGNSQVTIGGILVEDFNQNTMESKLQEGLYATGEVLDIDGDSGGFNLHFAWVCALAATESIRSKYEL